jgi:predicted amidohydrolase
MALAQYSLDEDPDKNLSKALATIDEAVSRGFDLLVFPESQFSPYFPQFPHRDANRYLVTTESPLLLELRDRCRDKHIHVAASVYLSEDGEGYSATFIIDGTGDILGCTKKMHITRQPSFYEQDYFTPGRDAPLVCETEIGRLGVVGCYDRH